MAEQNHVQIFISHSLPKTPLELGEVLWVITSTKTFSCTDNDEVSCLCKSRFYKELDVLLNINGLSRRRISAKTLPKDCMPVIYSEELIVRNGKPLALLAIKKEVENGIVKMSMDVLKVYNEEVRNVLCQKAPNMSACK